MAFFEGFSFVVIVDVSIFFTILFVSFKQVVFFGFLLWLSFLGLLLRTAFVLLGVWWLEGQVEEFVADLAHVHFDFLLVVWRLLI